MRFVFDVRPGDGSTRQWTKSADHLTIGRAPSCDVVLASEVVSGEHAAIDATGQRPVLSDLNSTNGTYVNGKRIETPTVLQVGDSIACGVDGPTLAILSLDAEAAVPATLRIRRDDIPTKGSMVRVGRAPDNDLVIDDSSVSAYHARVVISSPGRGVLEDLGSTNGSAVGDAENHVTNAEITAGDLLFFGSAPVRAESLLGSAAAPPAVLAFESATLRSLAGPTTVRRSNTTSLGMLLAVGAGFLGAVAIAAVYWKFASARAAAATEYDAAAMVAQARAAAARQAAQAPAKPSDGPAPDSTVAPPDFDKIARSGTSAIVWIGVKHKDYLFPYASAWAVKPTLLVTTAAAAVDLDKLTHKPDMEIVAWSGEAPIAVKSFKMHPQYSAANPTAVESLHFNLGLARLAGPVGGTLETASAEAARSLNLATPLMVEGFFSTLNGYDPYDRLKLRLEHTTLALRSTEDDRPGLPPLFLLTVASLKGQTAGGGGAAGAGHWLDGAPIRCGDGSVAGILSAGTTGARMVPIDASLWQNEP